MKPICCFVISLCFFCESSAQFFEGKVMYTLTYKSKDSNPLFASVVNTFMAQRKELLIKDGFYKSLMDGAIEAEAYNAKTNIYSYRTSLSPNIISVSASMSDDSVLGFKYFPDSNDTVMGIRCQKVGIKTKSKLITVYYNEKYSLNFALYSQHLINHFGIILGKTKAVPLKTIIADDNLITEITAVLIIPMEIRDTDLLL